MKVPHLILGQITMDTLGGYSNLSEFENEGGSNLSELSK